MLFKKLPHNSEMLQPLLNILTEKKMKDLKNHVDAVNSIDPDNYIANINGLGVDLQGFEGSVVVFSVGTVTDGTHVPQIEESDDNSNWTNVTSADLEGVLSDLVSDNNQRVGYKGAKRYLRAVLTVSGATIGAQVAGLVLRGIPHRAPVS
ncbi:MAG: hypothetical protein COW89_01000 [Nitrospinae bacterium CG22_combo_CG10-13_8_21_14_all_47_10]|nr:MAG: hypothetical protein COW89_01000 [Nitrospinae bacterium CG22_combo_CG10-13_8_21_14_all_47_10]